jgi:hypothetical protein
MHALKPSPNNETRSTRLIHNDDPFLPQVTSGIKLLKELCRLGVHVDPKSVKSAIIDRLVVYYGPGRSNKPYNRVAKARNPLNIEQMACQIDHALEGQVFTGMDLQKAIESRANARLLKLRRRRENRLVGLGLGSGSGSESKNPRMSAPDWWAGTFAGADGFPAQFCIIDHAYVEDGKADRLNCPSFYFVTGGQHLNTSTT